MTDVNLVLVEPSEVAGDATIALAADDRRAQHLRAVLGVAVGDRVKVGVTNGPRGAATVAAIDPEIRLVLEPGGEVPAPLPIEVVLAVPRPKVLSRTIEICASFGVERIALTNAWRVDKSYLKSPRMAAGALAHAARLGAEQGGTTWLPPIAVHARLMERLNTPWPDGATKLVAHPGGELLAAPIAGPVVLAVGPEGGWIEREVATFVDRGFRVVSLGAPILRVEAAVAALLGQLLMGMNAPAAR